MNKQANSLVVSLGKVLCGIAFTFEWLLSKQVLARFLDKLNEQVSSTVVVVMQFGIAIE